jgi:hypothetical protein
MLLPLAQLIELGEGHADDLIHIITAAGES